MGHPDPEMLGACRWTSGSSLQHSLLSLVAVSTISPPRQTPSAEARTGFLGAFPENVQAKSLVSLETAIQDRTQGLVGVKTQGSQKQPSQPFITCHLAAADYSSPSLNKVMMERQRVPAE